MLTPAGTRESPRPRAGGDAAGPGAPTGWVASLHGLRIRSPFPPGDRRAVGVRWSDVDVVATAAPVPPWWAEPMAGTRVTDRFRYARRADGAEYLRREGVAECVVAPDGRRIEYRPLAACLPAALEPYVLGPVLSFALLKRGIEPLHASAVLADAGALAFVGDAGRGKSTLAAAFVREGVPLVTDDLLAVGRAGGRVVTYPGPGRMNLWPGPARRLLGDDVRGARMGGRTRKRVFPLPSGRVVRGTRPVPLRAIYMLARPLRHGGVRIRPLSTREAFGRIVANTYNPVVDDRARLGRLIARAAALASCVPVRVLAFPRGLAALPGVLRAILADAAR